MDREQIVKFVDALENLWLQNQIAQDYLRTECGIVDPAEFLREAASKVPPDALAHRIFAPVKKVIGQSLQDSEALQALCKSLPELLKQGKNS